MHNFVRSVEATWRAEKIVELLFACFPRGTDLEAVTHLKAAVNQMILAATANAIEEIHANAPEKEYYGRCCRHCRQAAGRQY